MGAPPRLVCCVRVPSGPESRSAQRRLSAPRTAAGFHFAALGPNSRKETLEAARTLQQGRDAHGHGDGPESTHACHEPGHLSAEPSAALLLLGRQPQRIVIVNSGLWLRDEKVGHGGLRQDPSLKEGTLHIRQGLVGERVLSGCIRRRAVPYVTRNDCEQRFGPSALLPALADTLLLALVGALVRNAGSAGGGAIRLLLLGSP